MIIYSNGLAISLFISYLINLKVARNFILILTCRDGLTIPIIRKVKYAVSFF